MCGLDYFYIGNFAVHTHHATVRSATCRRKVNLVAVYAFTGLNIAVLVMDVRLYRATPLSFFLESICIRGIFLPFLALVHPVAGFLFRARSRLLQWVLRGAAILAVLLTAGCLIGQAVIPNYLLTFRFTALRSLPANWSAVADHPADLAVCAHRYDGLSVIDLLGLAFGGYDIGRSDDVFHAQMDFFFGPNATDRIDYDVHDLAAGVPLLIYNVSGTTVFAFRGFASGPELSVQVETLASLRVVPTIMGLFPFHDEINDLYLSSATAYARLLGLSRKLHRSMTT
jgi:hypothetical protein